MSLNTKPPLYNPMKQQPHPKEGKEERKERKEEQKEGKEGRKNENEERKEEKKQGKEERKNGKEERKKEGEGKRKNEKEERKEEKEERKHKGNSRYLPKTYMAMLTKVAFIFMFFALMGNTSTNSLNDNLLELGVATTNNNDAIVNMRPALDNFKTQILYKKTESEFIFRYLHFEDLREFLMVSKTLYRNIKQMKQYIAEMAEMQFKKIENHLKQVFGPLEIEQIGNFEKKMKGYIYDKQELIFEIGFTRGGFYFPFTLEFIHPSGRKHELKFLPSQNKQIQFSTEIGKDKITRGIRPFEDKFIYTSYIRKRFVLLTYKMHVEETENLAIILKESQKEVRKDQKKIFLSSGLFLVIWSLGVYATTTVKNEGGKEFLEINLTISMLFFLLFLWCKCRNYVIN